MASLRDVEELFASTSLTSSGRPVLLPSEVERHLLAGVDLELSFSDSKSPSGFVPYKSGILIITSHRLLWILSSANEAIAIPLSSVTHIFEINKSIKSMFNSPRIRFQALSKSSRTVIVTAVIRSKGSSSSSSEREVFVSKLWECWRARAWEEHDAEKGTLSSLTNSSKTGIYSDSGSVRMVGVSGILRKEQEVWESTDKTLQDAFLDLSALMTKAKEMMALAEKMRQKLLVATTDEEMGSKEEMQDWLLSVGIISPVTKESAGALYHQQLSRQLADFAITHLEKSGGMLNLVDVYCIFNRARGTELISPEDLLQASSLWEKFNAPVILRKLDSGVMVVQTKSHTDDEIFGRIKELVTKQVGLRSGVTASAAAMALRMAPAMAKEFLLSAEGKGFLCRDVSADGLCFYINFFHEISVDDLFLVKRNGAYSSWIGAQVTS